MKTKTLIVVGVIGMAAAFAPKARAGWSISVSVGTPVVYAPPPVVVAPAPPPVCPPRVVVAPPPVVCTPAPVYVPVRPAPACQPVRFVPPGHAKKFYKHHGYGKQGWAKHGRY